MPMLDATQQHLQSLSPRSIVKMVGRAGWRGGVRVGGVFVAA